MGEEILTALEELIGQRAIKGLYRVAVLEPALADPDAFLTQLEALDLHVVKRSIAGVPVWDVWWDAVSKHFYESDVIEEVPFDLQPKRKELGFRLPYLSLRSRTGAKPTLCIVGASGSVGKVTLTHLIAAGAHRSYDIRCTGNLRHLYPEVSWFNVDLLEEAQLEAFLIGCRSLLVSFSHTHSMRERYLQANALIEAAQHQHVLMVTMLSVAGAENSVVEWHAHEFRQLERVVEQSGLPYCIVRVML